MLPSVLAVLLSYFLVLAIFAEGCTMPVGRSRRLLFQAHTWLRGPARRFTTEVRTNGRSVGAGGLRAELDEKVSLAPMMEYTDRHFRYMLRLLSSRMVMYTEMVAANTLVYNEEARYRSLVFNEPIEHPVVLQLGGAEAVKLAEACEIALPYKYDAINLNCGCPSSKVAGSGCFGAALMREPAHVGELCRAMSDALPDTPITVKHRIGVDDQDSYDELARFVDVVAGRSGVKHFIVHARKALLNGISPEANRRVPPLKYDFVYRLVKEFPELRFTLNGGVLTYEDIETHLNNGVAGVMIGRAITARPFYWNDVDQRIYGHKDTPRLSRREVLEKYIQYAEAEEERAAGIKIRRQLAKHVHHLFSGEPNGKRFRALMDQQLCNPDAGIRQVIESATRVISDEVMDSRLSSYEVPPIEAVRH